MKNSGKRSFAAMQHGSYTSQVYPTSPSLLATSIPELSGPVPLSMRVLIPRFATRFATSRNRRVSDSNATGLPFFRAPHAHECELLRNRTARKADYPRTFPIRFREGVPGFRCGVTVLEEVSERRNGDEGAHRVLVRDAVGLHLPPPNVVGHRGVLVHLP